MLLRHGDLCDFGEGKGVNKVVSVIGVNIPLCSEIVVVLREITVKEITSC
jgi:hypothetical protein